MSDHWFDDPQENGQALARTRGQALNMVEDMPLAARPTAMPQHEQNLTELAALARVAPKRDLDRLMKEAREMGKLLGADLDDEGEGTAAFYRWKQGGKYIEGPTIDLMDALANQWGGIVYSIHMIGQPRGDQVVLRGRVLDLLRIVAHERDYIGYISPAPGNFKGEQAGRWLAMQMQAAESKAMRGVLEHVIPRAIINAAMEAAKDAAAEARLGGRTLDDATARSIKALETVGLRDIEQITRWVGRPPAQWTAVDLGALRSVYARAKRGELPADAFRVEAAQRAADRRDDEPTPPPTGDRFDTLGLGDSSSTAPSSASSPQVPPVSSPSQAAGAGGPATEATPPRNVATPLMDAQLLANALLGHPTPAQVDTTAKELFRTATGLSRVSTERWTECLRAGEAAGLFRRQNGALVVTRPEPAAEPNDGPNPPAVIPDDIAISIHEWETAVGGQIALEVAEKIGIPTPGDVPDISDITPMEAQRYRDALKARAEGK